MVPPVDEITEGEMVCVCPCIAEKQKQMIGIILKNAVIIILQM